MCRLWTELDRSEAGSAGSCWYYLNYLAPGERDVVVDPDLERYWLGPEHNAAAAARAGWLCRRGRRADASHWLHLAAAGFDATGVKMYAAACRAAGGDATSAAWMRAQGVRSPERMQRVLVPGSVG